MLIVGATACGGDDDDTTGATTSTTTTTTTAPPTRETSTVPSTAPASGRPADLADLANGPNYAESGGPSGAGCTPGAGARTLGRGWWPGEIKRIEGTTVDLDLVCYYVGSAAAEAAAADGEGLPNDEYVRNNNPRTFEATFPSLDTPATCVGLSNQPFPCTVGDVLDLYRAGPDQTKDVNDHEAYGFAVVWIHNRAQGEADYAYIQFAS